MANYVENIKVGSGEVWPIRDTEAQAAIASLKETLQTLPKNAFEASQTTASVTTYPTEPGIYRTIGTNIFENLSLRDDQCWGVLAIFRCGYALHMYIDTYGNMYWGRSGDDFTEPEAWRCGSNLRQAWVNQSPSSDFGAQTISLDLIGCSMVHIKFMYHTSTVDNAYCWWEACPVGQAGSTTYTSLSADNYAVTVYRSFNVSTNGITFGTGAFQQGTNTNLNDASRAIPIAIYIS